MMKNLVIILCCAVAANAGNHLFKESGNAFEGLSEIEADSLEECYYQCLFFDDCQTVSFDEFTKLCSIQLDNEVKSVKKDTENNAKFYTVDANQFYKGNMCWDKVQNKKIKGLTNIIVYRTMYLCLLYCIGVKICHSFTHDTDSEEPCWLQLAADALNITEDSFEPSSTATSYILDMDCFLKPELLSEGL